MKYEDERNLIDHYVLDIEKLHQELLDIHSSFVEEYMTMNSKNIDANLLQDFKTEVLSQINSINERELIYLYRLGSKEALDMLFDIYSVVIDKYSRVNLKTVDESAADDFKQEVLIKFTLFLDSYREDKKASPRTYFYGRLEKNLSKFWKVYRKERKLYGVSLSVSKDYSCMEAIENIIEDPREEYKPDVQMRKTAQRDLEEENLKAVASPLESAIYHYRNDGYSGEDIADLLDVSKKTVYNAMYRVQKKMGKMK